MKEEKRKAPYLDPEIKIVIFDSGDIISTSGGGGFSWSDAKGESDGDSDAWT